MREETNLESQLYSAVLILSEKFTKSIILEKYAFTYFSPQDHHKFEGEMYFETDIKKYVQPGWSWLSG